MTATEAFLEARNFLLAHREDYVKAYAGFRWPQLDSFNWALDWFDVYARNNSRTALWVVSRDAGETKLSFRELSERSNRVANFLRGKGVRRGDRILVMLSNVVPFWEVMLAAIKLGAVVIPATTMLSRDDLLDRFERGDVRHVVVGGSATRGKFAAIPGDYTRIAIGNAPGRLAAVRRRLSRLADLRAARADAGQCAAAALLSPQARRRSRSWSSTATSAIRSAICRPCTGSA